jgi:hypothetical protein
MIAFFSQPSAVLKSTGRPDEVSIAALIDKAFGALED